MYEDYQYLNKKVGISLLDLAVLLIIQAKDA